MKPKPLKSKKCRSCAKDFIPMSSTAVVCSMGCAISYSQAKQVKEVRKNATRERQERRAAINKLKPRGYFAGLAQEAVNAYRRAYCKLKNYPCISCGKYYDNYDCGHYLARSTHPELRFEEDNLWSQCYHCNHYNKNAHHAYREELIKRIGIERVEALEAHHPPAKLSIEDLKEIRRIYLDKAKQLKG